MHTSSRHRSRGEERGRGALLRRPPSGSLLSLVALLCLLLLAACSSGGPASGRPDGTPSHSGPLALDPTGATLWVVNPDADSVTAVDTEDLRAVAEVAVGREPWSVVVSPAGEVVVVNRAGGSLSFLSSGTREDLWIGAEPASIALSPSGHLAYVSLAAADEVAVVDVRAREVVERIEVPRLPWSVAVSDDGDLDDQDERIFVAHRLALPLGPPSGVERQGVVTVIEADGHEVRQVELPQYEFGFVNAVEGLAISGDRVYLAHLLNDPGLPRAFNTTVSAALSVVVAPSAAVDGVESTSAQRAAISSDTTESPLALHLNDPDFSTPVNFPRSLATSSDGRRAYIALAGSNAVMGIDVSEPEAPVLLGFWPAGMNPRGIVLDAAGERAFVMNYLSRDVSVLDLSDTVRRAEIARISATGETLSTSMIRGKTLFHDATDPRISRGGWISCASCHLDGGGDATSWVTPEGLRQTKPLWSLAGTLPLHASATRDEVQDFEADIELFMRGTGLAPGTHQPLLGEPNGGRSTDLDSLGEFVQHGFRTPRAAAPDSPQLVLTGRELFEGSGCAGCHGGPSWTTSTLPPEEDSSDADSEVLIAALQDVGTYDPAHDVLGERGFDPPTLLGLHASAPYLHDGSAASLEAVLANRLHTGVELSASEVEALVAFLESIDEGTEHVGVDSTSH